MKSKFLYSLLIAAGLVTPTFAGENLVAWLENSGAAAKHANYSGTLVLVRGERMRTLEIRQGFDGTRRLRYTRSISGPKRMEMLRLGDETLVVYPARKLVIHGVGKSGRALAQLADEVRHAPEHYELEDQGSDWVAGRDCRVVRFTPRDEYRYGCELCVDRESGLLLRARVVTAMGDLLEQFAFTSVELRDAFASFAPGSFELRTDTRGFDEFFMPYGAKPASAKWAVEKLPPGFTVHEGVARMRRGAVEPVHHMVVSDALTRVSVFIDRLPKGAAGMRERFARFAHHGYMRMQNGHQIMVIGNAPIETVRMIGDSLRMQR